MRVNEVFPCNMLATVAAYRPGTQQSGAGGQPVNTPTSLGTMPAHIEKLSGGQAARAFGDQSSSRWRLTLDADRDLQADDLVLVSSGPYTGTKLQVEDVTVPGGMLLMAACEDTDKALS